MAARPVITTEDAGGILEFIENDQDGWVTRADEREIALALTRAFEDERRCRAFGERGRERVRGITWETVVEQLTN